MASDLPFEILYAIVCEDIREEKTGKHMLVGVFSGDNIQVSHMPGNMAIACYMKVRILEAGTHELRVRIAGPGDQEAMLKARLDFPPEKGLAIIATPRVDLSVENDGTLRMDISSDEKTWINLATLDITLNPSLASARSQHSGLSPSAAPET